MSTCERHKDHPENSVMTPEMMLDHFLHCVRPERQLEMLTALKDGAIQGSACWRANHQGVIQSQAQYTAKLLTGIREVIETLGELPESGEVYDQYVKLKALIS